VLPGARRDEKPSMQQPPLLPFETYRRVLRLGKMDGSSILLVAGVFALLQAVAGDVSGAMVGLLVAGAGAVELHGVGLLEEGEARGMDWLIGSQIFLLASLLGYCAIRLGHIELPPVPDAIAPMIDRSAAQMNMSRDEYLRFIQRLGLQIVAGVSLLYQGGMTIYYVRRRETVRRALFEFTDVA
jgi:hypothetical protein